MKIEEAAFITIKDTESELPLKACETK